MIETQCHSRKPRCQSGIGDRGTRSGQPPSSRASLHATKTQDNWEDLADGVNDKMAGDIRGANLRRAAGSLESDPSVPIARRNADLALTDWLSPNDRQ